MRSPRKLTILGAAALVLTIGAAPFLTSAADHIDASAFGSIGSPGGNFAPNSVNGERDINDVYAFQGSDASRTVLVMTTNPAINLFGGNFGTNVRYILNVDNDGDAIQDLAYVVRFGDQDSAGNQHFKITAYEGSRAQSLTGGKPIVQGFTNAKGKVKADDGLWAFAGVRSDPFFFDLTGFAGTLFNIGTDDLGANPTDFFAPLNTNAIVIEVPDDQLGGAIGVWAQTTWWDGSAWQPGDQMGRPAINTVFNTILVDASAGQTKNQFNATPPSQQRTAFGGKFRTNVVNTLEALGGYDPMGAGGVIADILLPDVLTYNTATTAEFLNGRDLDDDVIDIELALVTAGGITGDGVGPHSDYQAAFPYLGVPH